MENNSNFHNEENNNFPGNTTNIDNNQSIDSTQQSNSNDNHNNQQYSSQSAYQNDNNYYQHNQNYYDVPPNQLPPIQNDYYSQKLKEPMSMKDWLITELLLMIPIVNIVLLIVWACDSSTNENKRNFSKARLVIMLISIGIVIVLSILMFTFVLTVAKNLYYY